jgi:putative protein-disulfide isomerase
MKNQTKIYYIMDSMCGWCYGFSHTIKRIYDEFKNDLDFIIVPGGMWIRGDVKPVNENMAFHINEFNKKITGMTGITFGDNFKTNVLQKKGLILDSMPGAKALVLIQDLKREIRFEYLQKIQEAFFIEGKDPNDIDLYADIAQGFGISKDRFIEQYNSVELENKTNEGFKFAARLGVTGFPSIFAENNEILFPVSHGLRFFEEIHKMIAKIV